MQLLDAAAVTVNRFLDTSIKYLCYLKCSTQQNTTEGYEWLRFKAHYIKLAQQWNYTIHMSPGDDKTPVRIPSALIITMQSDIYLFSTTSWKLIILFTAAYRTKATV